MSTTAAVMKRCTDCKRRLKGDRERAQWCPDCGGEMRRIPYASQYRKGSRGRG